MTRVRVIAAALCVLGVVAGCGEEPAPRVGEPAASSALPIIFDPHDEAPSFGTVENVERSTRGVAAEVVPFGVRPVATRAPEAVDDETGLPSYGEVPEFTLTDQDGVPFAHTDMLGDVWVVDFMFTRCAGICVPMTRTLVEMQRAELPARYLSISVDPKNDTPDVLHAYRKARGGDEQRWQLLTGDDDLITGLSEGGFTLPVQVRRESVPMEGMPSIFHSGRFALVDRQGHVRGFFDHESQDEVAALYDAIHVLSAQ